MVEFAIEKCKPYGYYGVGVQDGKNLKELWKLVEFTETKIMKKKHTQSEENIVIQSPPNLEIRHVWSMIFRSVV